VIRFWWQSGHTIRIQEFSKGYIGLFLSGHSINLLPASSDHLPLNNCLKSVQNARWQHYSAEVCGVPELLVVAVTAHFLPLAGLLDMTTVLLFDHIYVVVVCFAILTRKYVAAD